MANDKRPYNKLFAIPFYQVQINDTFWSKRQKINREVSINLQYEKLEEDHHIDNFRVAAGIKKDIQQGEFYFDSDLYKWLEAAGYFLHLQNDKDLETKVNQIVGLISKSQAKDGYINTFYSTKFIEKRFTNVAFMHELYCAGHLIQAAIAHYEATGSNFLLEVAEKFAYLLYQIFMGSRKNEAPGHEEIEMALVELFRITNNLTFLKLAEAFINRRGKLANLKGYIIKKYVNLISTLKEAKKLNETFKLNNNDIQYNKRGDQDEVEDFYEDLTLIERIKFLYGTLNGKTYQLNLPVRDNFEPVGHAVRAMYLYCGMADLYSEIGDQALLKVLKILWLKMVKAKMYVSGGIGSIKGIEGFEKDFKLKIEKSYSETCAAIGSIMWNWRMLNITGHCKYADLIEKLLYNAMLVGQSLDGKKYFYSNPLVSNGDHDRKEWFLCACCPPNFARTIASIGKYIYSVSEEGLWIHQYIGSLGNIKYNNNNIRVVQESEFPWKGNVKIILELEKNLKFSIFLRIPQWSNDTDLSINGEKFYGSMTSGRYIKILRNWLNNDFIEINFQMEPKILENDLRMKSSRERGALSYGPLIYCLEQTDNNFEIMDAVIPKNQAFQTIFQPNFLDGTIVIQGNISTGQKFVAIPYFSWNNRGPTRMQVWNKTI